MQIIIQSEAPRPTVKWMFCLLRLFFLSKILVFKLLSHATWNLETGRRLWTSTRQYTTQTGSTHSYTNTTTALPENACTPSSNINRSTHSLLRDSLSSTARSILHPSFSQPSTPPKRPRPMTPPSGTLKVPEHRLPPW